MIWPSFHDSSCLVLFSKNCKYSQFSISRVKLKYYWFAVVRRTLFGVSKNLSKKFYSRAEAKIYEFSTLKQNSHNTKQEQTWILEICCIFFGSKPINNSINIKILFIIKRVFHSKQKKHQWKKGSVQWSRFLAETNMELHKVVRLDWEYVQECFSTVNLVLLSSQMTQHERLNPKHQNVIFFWFNLMTHLDHEWCWCPFDFLRLNVFVDVDFCLNIELCLSVDVIKNQITVNFKSRKCQILTITEMEKHEEKNKKILTWWPFELSPVWRILKIEKNEFSSSVQISQVCVAPTADKEISFTCFWMIVQLDPPSFDPYNDRNENTRLSVSTPNELTF